MAIRTFVSRSLEKLSPPTTVAGHAAEAAYVTRHFQSDDDTGKSVEYGTPVIQIVWNKTAAQIVADLSAEKLAVIARANEKVAELDKAAQDVSKAGVAVEEAGRGG